MTPGSTQSNWRVRWLKYLLIVTAAGLLFLSVFAWYATTPSFQLMVRRRLVAELERVTGGRVELGGFHTIPFRLELDVRDLTIHGRENPGDMPLLHVDRLLAHVKLISVLGAEFGFHSVLLDRPVVHIITYPDGTTNRPVPTAVTANAKAELERLVSFSITRLEIRQGQVLWNDQKIPLDFAADDISARLHYSFLHQRYDGTLSVGKADTNIASYRPVAWTGEAQFQLSDDGVILNSLKATSGRCHVTVRGRMVDFNNPSIVGEYDMIADFGELGAIARQPQIRGGTLHVTGGGSWSRTVFSTTGKLQGKDLEWREESFHLERANISTQFTANPQRFTLLDLKAILLDGEVTGEAQVFNWQGTTQLKRAGTGEQKGSVRLTIKGISAEALALALSSKARPISRVNAAGTINGSVDTQWKGAPRNAVSELKLNVVAPQNTRPDQLPVTAQLVASYRAAAGELE
ncbi:MAG: hypothetical protein JOZ80_02265, partial [Acidobacteriaceae bacterium]|nr:hypothetical protein [Acidobacteriaceae bacterium]